MKFDVDSARELVWKYEIETTKKQNEESEKRINSGKYDRFFNMIQYAAMNGHEVLYLYVQVLVNEGIEPKEFIVDLRNLGYAVKASVIYKGSIEVSWPKEIKDNTPEQLLERLNKEK